MSALRPCLPFTPAVDDETQCDVVKLYIARLLSDLSKIIALNRRLAASLLADLLKILASV